MDLKQRFAAEFRLHTSEPGAVFDIGAAALRKKNAEAAALYARSPKPALGREQRSELAARRSPVLGELLRHCAAGLSRHKEIVQECQVSPESCQRTAALDLATGMLIKATGDVYSRATAGLEQVAAEANRLGEHALTEVHQRIVSGDASDGDPQVLETAFCEAFRLYLEAGARVERAAARLARRIAPLQARTASARARAGEADALSELLSKNRT